MVLLSLFYYGIYVLNGKMMTYNINNKKQFPRYHLYAFRDGINLFCTSPITVDDILIIGGVEHSLGKGKGMSSQANKRTEDGLYYQEFTIHKIEQP